MMRPTTVAAALALLLLASTASAWPGAQECGACPLDNGCICSACALDTVFLGDVAAFVVLAGHEVTTGSGVASQILGDLGVYPGSSVTGHPDMRNGSAIQIANGASDAGMAALTVAYNDAAGRSLCPVAVAGNLGGLTLYPGLYKSTDGLEITGSDLTLHGGADDVFIFQMASTFLITTGMKVTLAGGTQAKNVFWQVGTSATLMGSTVLEGTMMADQSITSGTGAVLNGRVLARIASVTMESAVFSLP
ncbi:hypothetical protein FOA52_015587 [Chlamydomonas sp. UWO 241]|nr:hypothetical protein FOA52_015587 [Chlamydomonas sp. UWO 241]